MREIVMFVELMILIAFISVFTGAFWTFDCWLDRFERHEDRSP